MARDDETGNSLKLIAGSSLIVLIAIISSKLISYVYKILVARVFGPEAYGLFSLGLIILGVFMALATLGLADGLLRYVSFYRGKEEFGKIKFLINKSFKIMFIGSIISVIILMLLADIIAVYIFHNPELAYYLRILAISLPFGVFSGALLAIIRAFENIKAYAFLMNFLQNFLKVAFLAILIFAGWKGDAILFSYVLAYIALAISAYLIYKKQVSAVYSKADRDLTRSERKNVTKDLFVYSWPLTFSGMVLALFFWTDSLLLGFFTNANDVGIYSAAITIVGLFSISQDIFMQIFVPIVSKNLSMGKKELIRDITKQISKWILLLNIPLFIALFFFPETIINILFGEQYLGATSALRILAVGGIFIGFTNLFVSLINIKGGTKRVLVIFLLFSILNAILDIILIPIYGIVGAAIATTITWFLFAIVLVINIKKSYGFYPLNKTFIKIIGVSFIPSVLFYILSGMFKHSLTNLIALGVSFVLVYLLLILLTKCLDRNDLDIITAAKNRVMRIGGLRYQEPYPEV